KKTTRRLMATAVMRKEQARRTHRKHDHRPPSSGYQKYCATFARHGCRPGTLGSQLAVVATCRGTRLANSGAVVYLGRPAGCPLPRQPRRVRRCRSSVVEHSLGKGEVVSSILTGSTS